MMNRQLADTIYSILMAKEYLRERKETNKLISWVHAVEMGFRVENEPEDLVKFLAKISLAKYFAMVNRKQLSGYESITRVKRLVQEAHPKLRGKDYKQKDELEEKTINNLKNILTDLKAEGI